MIVNFSIKNFRSLKDEITLSFEAERFDKLEEQYVCTLGDKKQFRILKLGLIFGANASGKTNILLALNSLRKLVIEPLEKKTDHLKFEPFLFDATSKNQNTVFEIEFITNDIKYYYFLEFNKKAISYEELRFSSSKGALIFERTTDQEKLLATISFGKKFNIKKNQKANLEANTLSNNTVLGGYLKTNFESKELQDTIDWFEKSLHSLIKPKTDLTSFVLRKFDQGKMDKNIILQSLNNADFNISDLKIEEKAKKLPKEIIDAILASLPLNEETQKKMEKDGEIKSIEINLIHKLPNGDEFELPISEESAGTQRYFQFSGILSYLIQNKVVFPIDEFESSLHPDLIKHFLLSFLDHSEQSQIIASTHYRELLMEKDIFRNDAIWFTEKKEEAFTYLYSLNDFDSSVIRDTSSIYNAYKAGKLGGNPYIYDRFIEKPDNEEES